jgi:hypothetical protein
LNQGDGLGKHNPSHIIHDLRFGPTIDEAELKGAEEWSNPLKGTEKATDESNVPSPNPN